MTVAIVFPGQGAHREGMASAWRGHPAHATFAEVGRVCGLPDLPALADDPRACASTAIAQPAVFAAGIAAWRALTDMGLQPAFVAGHSLGEVTAAVAAGALSMHDGAVLVGERGRAFAAACARNLGTMGAVLGLDRETVQQAIDGIPCATIANDNAPGQVVVAGPPEAVEAAVAACRAAGARVRMLDVEGAFHTPAMSPAIVRVAAALRHLDTRDPLVPLVRGATADLATTRPEVERGLVDGVLAPVRWRGVQEQLAALGVAFLVEAGGGVLKAMAKRTVPEATALAVDGPEAAAAAVATIAASVSVDRSQEVSVR